MVNIFKKKPLPRTLKSVYTDMDKATDEAAGFVPADTSVTNAKLATDLKVGSVAALDTTEKTEVVGAINEVDAKVETNILDIADRYEKPELGVPKANLVQAVQDSLDVADTVGAVASLTTEEKASIVGAINELVSRVVALEGA